MARRQQLLLALGPAVLLAAAAPALANAATYLMVGAVSGLCINPLLGLLEGGVVMLVSRTRAWRLMPLMVVANLVSWPCGALVAGVVSHGLAPLMLRDSAVEQGDAYVAALGPLLLAAFLGASVFVEWPFCRSGLPPERRQWKRSLGVCALAQVASYAVLTPFLFATMGLGETTSLYRNFRADRTCLRDAGVDATIYYTNPEGALCSVQLDGTGAVGLLPASSPAGAEMRRSPDGWGWDLWCGSRKSEWMAISHASLQRAAGYEVEHPGYDPVDLRPAGDREWSLGMWMSDGFTLRGPEGADDREVSIGVPGLRLHPQYVTLLPGELAVLEFGGPPFAGTPGEIVLLDIGRHRLARIAEGSAPVVVLNEYGPKGEARVDPGPARPPAGPA